jgi:hypothetical protein
MLQPSVATVFSFLAARICFGATWSFGCNLLCVHVAESAWYLGASVARSEAHQLLA